VGRPWEIDDGLWALIEPLLPPWPARSPGPRPVPDRLCLQGILFVLSTGIGWEDLPRELGYGSGMTCWRRLRRWTDAGVFDRLYRLLLAELNAAGRIDWSRAIIDGGHITAKKGARGPAPPRSTGVNQAAGITWSPTARGHPLCRVDHRWERAGHQQSRRPGRRGTTHRRTTRQAPPTVPVLLADKGYDSARFRTACRQRRTEPIIPQRGRKHIKGLGRLRYVVEQSIALLHQFRRLAVRWERHLDLHEALVSLACALICWRRLIKQTTSRSC